jgi:streptogramin lyase
MSKRSLISMIVLVLASAALTVGAAASAGAKAVHGNKIEGTWVATINRPAPLPPLTSLQVFTADGGLVEMSNEPQASRTAQYGTWERIGGRLYASTGMLFRFDPATGAHVATMKINGTIRLSDDGETFTRAARATTYDLSGNVIASFPVQATGERLQVERIPDEP